MTHKADIIAMLILAPPMMAIVLLQFLLPAPPDRWWGRIKAMPRLASMRWSDSIIFKLDEWFWDCVERFAAKLEERVRKPQAAKNDGLAARLMASAVMTQPDLVFNVRVPNRKQCLDSIKRLKVGELFTCKDSSPSTVYRHARKHGIKLKTVDKGLYVRCAK